MPGHAMQYKHAQADWVIEDPGDGKPIPVSRSGVCRMRSGASAETRTLPDPTYVGQWLILNLDVDGGGDVVVTVASVINDTGNSALTFDGAGNNLTLMAISASGALRWQNQIQLMQGGVSAS